MITQNILEKINNVPQYARDGDSILNNELVKLMIDQFPAIISVKDAKNLRFILINHLAEKFWGCTNDQIKGKNDFDLYPSDMASYYISRDREVLASKKSLDINEELRLGDLGNRVLKTRKFPVYNTKGEALYLFSLSEDITDQKLLMEKNLRAEAMLMSATRINSLIEHSLEAVIAMDQDGIITNWNPQCVVTFGWQKTEAINKTVESLIMPLRYRELHRKGLEKFLKTGEGKIINKRVELTATHQSGLEFPIELTVIPIANEKKYYFYAFIRDISDRKRLQDQHIHLLERERELRVTAEESLKMRDDFLSLAAHELKTPITSLALQLQIIERYVGDLKNQKPLIERASTLLEVTRNSKLELDHFNKLIDVLMDVTRISAGRLSLNITKINMVPIIQNIAERFRKALQEASSKLTLDLPTELIGSWDKSRIESVIENLLSNAIKYGLGKPITIKLIGTDHSAIINVIDQGIGISKEDQKKIFKRFERVVPINKFSGLGLGLYIAKSIVEAHHGTITVDSDVLMGSTFTVELPLQWSSN